MNECFSTVAVDVDLIKARPEVLLDWLHGVVVNRFTLHVKDPQSVSDRKHKPELLLLTAAPGLGKCGDHVEIREQFKAASSLSRLKAS